MTHPNPNVPDLTQLQHRMVAALHDASLATAYPVVNLTPHDVAIYRDGELTITLPPSGWVVRLVEEDNEEKFIGDLPAPLLERKLGKVVVKHEEHGDEELPEPMLGQGRTPCYLVVSLPVAQALTDRPDVVAPDTGAGAVRSEDGSILGTTRFIRVAK